MLELTLKLGRLGAVLVLSLAAGAASLACARSTRGFQDDGPTFGADGGTTGEGGARVLDECAEATKDPYLIARDNTLWQFHPPTLDLQNKGAIACPTGGATPTSMAIDRHGVAWVRHSDGSIWKVSTKDLSCEATSFQSPGDDFSRFGMGFASETKGSSNEVLFLSDSYGAGLGRLDTTTMQVRFVGPYTGALEGKGSELTGTGDGKLYGFFTTVPAQIAEIAKGTGQIVDPRELPGVTAGEAWAFSFYGGDFYVYTSASAQPGAPPEAGGGSAITRFRPSDGAIEVVKPNFGFTIVGAGVSTCAPTSSPR